MKKIFLLITLTLVFSIQAFGHEKPEFLDSNYCTEIEGVEYCVYFVQGPFGPGYRGELYCEYRERSPFSPVVWNGPVFMSSFYKRENEPIKLPNLDMEVQIKDNGLEIYKPKKEILFLEKKE